MSDAFLAFFGAMAGSFVAGLLSLEQQRRQFKHAEEMKLLESKGPEAVKALLSEMLNHRSYTDRSFNALKAPVGGYADDEIRRLLHELEAKKVIREDGSEWWYLLIRQDERIAKRQSSNA